MIAAFTETAQSFPVLPALPPAAAIASLGTVAYLLENSRLGFATYDSTWQPGFVIANRQSALGLQADVRQTHVRSRCTGKERDTETGLDYFGARYFSSAQGRFTTPDWSMTPEPVPYADLNDPQTLNLYGYVRNNPLSKADPDGHLGCGFLWLGNCPAPAPPPPPPAPPAPTNPVYSTPDAAAVAASRADAQRTQQTGAEYASSVHTIGPGYTFTAPVTQGQPDTVDPNNTTGVPLAKPVDFRLAPIPPGTQLVGEAHSHPIEFPAAEGNFSGQDIQRGHDMTLRYYGHPLYQGIYVGLPSGTVQKYDPFTGHIITFLPKVRR